MLILVELIRTDATPITRQVTIIAIISMRVVVLALLAAISSSAGAGTQFDPDACVESVERLKKAVISTSDYADQAASDHENSSVLSALSDVESKLSRARSDCGAVDFCTSLKTAARQIGADAVYSLCLAYESGDRLAACKACLGK